MCLEFLVSIVNETAPILAILRQKHDALKPEVVKFDFDLSKIFDCDIFKGLVLDNLLTVTEFELI